MHVIVGLFVGVGTTRTKVAVFLACALPEIKKNSQGPGITGSSVQG